ncbi:MAG: hypothetical protein HC892_14440 [Saprospiraceae bacterium]|nr:hypothetical protein [Saprospiraceae bacterium]
METIKDTVQKLVRQTSNLPTYLSDTFPKFKESNKNNEISIYVGELTPAIVAKTTKKLKDLFPLTPPTFWHELIERIKEHNFSDSRFIDASNYVIDNHKYPTLMIADFIGFDKTIKLHTYAEMSQVVFELKSTSTKEFVRVQKKGVNYWVKMLDYNTNKGIFENAKL